MPTTKTRNELVTQALSNLGVLAAGQTPSTEDFESVDGHVDQTIEALEADEIITVDDLSAIPSEWFQPLSVILADDAAMEFGLPGVPPSPGNPNPVAAAQATLRTRVRGRPTGQPLRIDYF